MLARSCVCLLLLLAVTLAGCRRPPATKPEPRLNGSYLAAYTLTGERKWEKYLGDADYDLLQATAQGHLLLVGRQPRDADFESVITVMQPQGEVSWQFLSGDVGYLNTTVRDVFLGQQLETVCAAYQDTGTDNCYTGVVWSFDAFGNLQGSIPIESFSPATPYRSFAQMHRAPSGAVYYLHQHAAFQFDLLVGFDVSGKLLCVYPATTIESWAIAGDGTLFALTDDGYLAHLAEDGRELWRRPGRLAEGFFAKLTWSPAGYLLAYTPEQRLVALDPDGRQLWRYGAPNQHLFGEPDFGPDNCLYVEGSETVDGEDSMYRVALDSTGQELWRFTYPPSLYNSWPPMPGPLGDSALFYTLESGEKSAIAVLDAAGRQKWALNEPRGSDVARGPAGEVCFTSDGSVVVVSAEGQELWRQQILDTAEDVNARLAIEVAGNTLYALYNTQVEDYGASNSNRTRLGD